MRISHFTIFALLFALLCPSETTAQSNLPQTSRKTINGKEYHLYRIEEEDSLDGVCATFDITPEVLVQYNPEIKRGDFAAGHLLLIPVRYQTAQINSAEKIFNHIVSSGETLYSLSRTYGVPINRITALNPNAEEVIRVGDTLRIPQSAIEGNPIESQDAYIYHTIAVGETLYSLATRYKTGVSDILEQNPGVDPHQLKVGEVIRIASDNQNITPDKRPEVFYYTVKGKKETIESVAQQFGVTVDEILAVNNGRNIVQRGNTVAIPKKEPEQPAIDNFIPERRRNREEGIYSVAVMLPFMTDRAEDMRAALYTEFYQGFLLAADSMKRTGMSLNIYALDTRGSHATVEALLSELPEKKLDLIIGPVENDDIASVAAYARENGIFVVNPFGVKNEEAERNPNVFQCNIPHESLYARSRDKIVAEIGERTIVFIIDDSGTESGKNEHIAQLKAKLLRQGKNFVEISLGQDPLLESFDAMVPHARELAVLTNSASRASTGKMLASLSKLKESHPSLDIALYGYPEWQVYIKENMEAFCRLNTTIFSRFYALPADTAAADVQDKFLYWFRKDMLQANPLHVYLGYDTGLFFLSALRSFGSYLENGIESVSYPGIQTGFQFRRINNWSGFSNESFFFVRFRPTFDITRETLLVK